MPDEPQQTDTEPEPALPLPPLEPLDVLRRQWCAEPTVHGGKSTRSQ